jgi:hypothetical protein
MADSPAKASSSCVIHDQAVRWELAEACFDFGVKAGNDVIAVLLY